MLTKLLMPVGNGKTGKREAAWAMVVIAFLLTVADMVLAAVFGPEKTRDLNSLLLLLWPSVTANIGYAYKLQNDNKRIGLAEPGEKKPEPYTDYMHPPEGSAG